MIENINSTFMPDEIVCYFCNEDIHNFETERLFDGRVVKSCYDCYMEIELGKQVYYAKLNEATG